ncbi:MAG TPA: PAS domain S-box protein [Longimicrobiales bacterium]
MSEDDRLYQQILEALRQSEARYRHLTEFATDIIYTHTLDGRLITVNQAGERVFGYSREEFIGKNILDIIVPEHREIARQRTEEKVLAGGGSTTYTVDVMSKLGNRVTLEVNTHIIFDQGSPLAVQGIGRDVTERQRATQALAEREQFFRAITERTSDLIMIVDEEARVKYASPSYEAILGYSTQKLIGQSSLPIMHPDDLPEALKNLSRLVDDNLPLVAGEYRIVDADGVMHLVDFRARNLLDDPAIRGIVVDARDITERRKAEHALRASEERFRKVLEVSGEGIVMRNAKGTITFANERFADMLGYTVDEIVGKDVEDIIAPSALPSQRASAKRRRESGVAETLDMEFLRKDGTIMPAILSVSPTFGDDGSFTGALGMITDITERKQLEEQLRQSQKMEAVGRLAGGVAHDFNNLLTAIEGHVDLVLAELPPDSSLRNDVGEIRKAAERAASLTQQLLAFSRRQMLQPVVLEIDAVIGDMDTMLRRVITEDIEFVTELNAPGVRVLADRSQVENVVLNVIVNAREAMPRGGQLRVSTDAVVLDQEFARVNKGARPGSYVRIRVQDSGIGMDTETLKHIFEPFFTTKGIGKATGLGLATAYGIVKQSEGYIRAESALNRGTTFEVYLPRVEAPVRTSRGAAANGGHVEAAVTILVAEDESAVRALTCRILRKKGYHVLEARDGREAVEVASRHDGNINLLVTDVIMPNMGGRELSETLRGVMPDVKVLFMSGYTDDQLLQRGVLQSGTGNFLEKPFTPDGLARKVREVLDSE